MSRQTSSGGGGGFFGMLQVALIVLKLLDKIDWSWGAVLWPTWILVGLIALYVILAILG